MTLSVQLCSDKLFPRVFSWWAYNIVGNFKTLDIRRKYSENERLVDTRYEEWLKTSVLLFVLIVSAVKWSSTSFWISIKLDRQRNYALHYVHKCIWIIHSFVFFINSLFSGKVAVLMSCSLVARNLECLCLIDHPPAGSMLENIATL